MTCCSSCGGTITTSFTEDLCEICTCQGTPAPYYNECGAIQEPHCMPVINELFAAALASSSAFAMPAVNGSAVVLFSGVKQILIGSYLWNTTYGYLEVTGFDYLTGEITLENHGTGGNAAPGTIIARCTLFVVTTPP